MAIIIDVERTIINKEDVNVSLDVPRNVKNGTTIDIETLKNPKSGTIISVECPQGNFKD